MSQDIQPIMQAAERLRRHTAGEDQLAIWPDESFTHSCKLLTDDIFTLKDWALSILPVKNPVSVPASSLAFADQKQKWAYRWDQVHPGWRLHFSGDDPLFETKDDAAAGLILASLKRHMRIAANPVATP
jgi:hypothetical protein